MIDVSGLSAGEIVAVNRYVRNQEQLARQRDDRAAVTLYQRYADGLLEALADLPTRDHTQGYAVFTALSESPDQRDRSDAAICLPNLLKADHPFGLMLFDRLLRDPDSSVRLQAAQLLASLNPAPTATDEVRQQVIEWRTELSVMEDEVVQLQHVAIQAERGEGIYRLGEVVLNRLLASGETTAADASPRTT